MQVRVDLRVYFFVESCCCNTLEFENVPKRSAPFWEKRGWGPLTQHLHDCPAFAQCSRPRLNRACPETPVFEQRPSALLFLVS